MLIFLSAVSILQAADVNFEMTVDKNKVSMDQRIQLNFTFYGTQDIPVLQLPELDSFTSRYLGPSTKMTIVNGKTSTSITHMYMLLPLRPGTYQIGPFSFDYNGNTYSARPVTVEVMDKLAPGEPQAGSADQHMSDLKKRIFLAMEPAKTNAYLNEVIPLKVKLYVNRLSVRDIQFPQFEHEGFSAGEFEKPIQYQESLGGVLYDVIEFGATLFGTRPGEIMLGPAQIMCNVVVKKKQANRGIRGFGDMFEDDIFDDFFSRYETYPLNLKSTDVPITIKPLPEENRPQEFRGAVGNFDLDVQVSPTEVKVGDPITVRMIVTGDGNPNTINAPVLISQEGFKVYEPQVSEKENAKIFEQVLIPKSETMTQVPGMVFSFFDTNAGLYRTVSKGPFPVKVLKSETNKDLKIIEVRKSDETPLGSETLGSDIVYIKESPGKISKIGYHLYKDRIFLVSQLLPLSLYLIFFISYRRRQRLKDDVRYARRLLAPKKARSGMQKAKALIQEGKTAEFYDTVFKTIQEYLGDKFHLSSKSITENVIKDVLRSKNIPEETLNILRGIFTACDAVRYAPSGFKKENMESIFKDLENIIDYFERQKI